MRYAVSVLVHTDSVLVRRPFSTPGLGGRIGETLLTGLYGGGEAKSWWTTIVFFSQGLFETGRGNWIVRESCEHIQDGKEMGRYVFLESIRQHYKITFVSFFSDNRWTWIILQRLENALKSQPSYTRAWKTIWGLPQTMPRQQNVIRKLMERVCSDFSTFCCSSLAVWAVVCFSAAGNAFCQSAQLHLRLNNRHEAATNYIDAGTCYKKADPNGSIFRSGVTHPLFPSMIFLWFVNCDFCDFRLLCDKLLTTVLLFVCWEKTVGMREHIFIKQENWQND